MKMIKKILGTILIYTVLILSFIIAIIAVIFRFVGVVATKIGNTLGNISIEIAEFFEGE